MPDDRIRRTLSPIRRSPGSRVPHMNRSLGTALPPSRRAFLRRTAQTAAGFAFPTIIPGSALGLGGRVAPSDRITVGVIGTGNQGFNDINSFLQDERVQ